MPLPPSVESLIAEFARFPGVGRRSAERMVFDLVGASRERTSHLVDALHRLGEAIGTCADCGYFTEDGRCLLCSASREETMLVVVERATDVIAFENAGGYRGLYHVLGGQLSPLKGIGPSHLRLAQLQQRLSRLPVRELILATSPNVEGDATALYIAREYAREGLAITRLGRGVPMGSSLEFSDAGTLRLALEGRRALGHS